MKHQEVVNELSRYLGLMSQELSPKGLDLLARHLELVIEANERINLTRVSDPEAAVRLHTADSLSVLEDLALAPEGKLLDIGSGAGFPGIPLAVASGRRVVLLDSVGKKVRELQLIVTALGLGDVVQAEAGRAEALARTRQGEFSVVTARAVSELPALVELASPLLRQGGRLVCLKGTPDPSEKERADKVAALVGLRLQYVREFDLPEGVGHRTILVYGKISRSLLELPRREGMAQHSPLG